MMASAPVTAGDERVLTDNVSHEKSQDPTDSPIVLKVDIVKDIERQLLLYEKVSLCFLFYDDRGLSLRLCEKCIFETNFRLLKNFVHENPPELWSMKLLECLYYLQNYALLERYGMSKYDADEKFKSTSYIQPIRLLLYKICESLTLDEAKLLISSVGSDCDPEFLEIWFLKLKEQSEWRIAIDVLKKLDKVTQFLVELNNADFESLFSIKSSLENVDGTEDTNNIVGARALGNNVYPIHDPDNVGLCIIINENFKGEEERLGSDKDVAALEETMKEFNFEIKTFIDVPSTFFCGPFVNHIKNSFKKTHSIFFLAILSHGKQGCIKCVDDKLISIEYHILKGLSILPQLKDIPKVVIFQACQGDKYLLSNKIASDGVPLTNIQFDESRKPLSDYCGSYISNAIIAMSTVPGFKSFRDTDKGSIFIQTLCQCLKTYPFESVADIITEVIKEVTEEVVKSVFKNINFGQQPEYRSMLSKKLYLKRKPTSLF